MHQSNSFVSLHKNDAAMKWILIEKCLVRIRTTFERAKSVTFSNYHCMTFETFAKRILYFCNYKNKEQRDSYFYNPEYHTVNHFTCISDASFRLSLIILSQSRSDANIVWDWGRQRGKAKKNNIRKWKGEKGKSWKISII